MGAVLQQASGQTECCESEVLEKRIESTVVAARNESAPKLK